MSENSLKIGYQTLNKIILGWTGCQNKKGFMNLSVYCLSVNINFQYNINFMTKHTWITRTALLF